MKNVLARRFPWLATAILSLPLIVIAYLGSFTRLHADDFCAIGQMKQSGFWPALEYWYQTWNGRFAFTFFSQVFGKGGTVLARFLPFIVLVCWLIGLTWFYYAIMKHLRRLVLSNQEIPLQRNTIWDAVLLAAASVYLVLQTIPNLFQSFLWESGMVNYTMPIILVTYLAAVLMSWDTKKYPSHDIKLRFRLVFVILAFISLISSGFSETHSIVQITLIFFWLCLMILQVKTKSLTHEITLLITVLVGTIAGFLITAAAPGNEIRMQAINPEKFYPNPVTVLISASQNAYITVHAVLKHHWLELAVSFGAAVSIGFLNTKRTTQVSHKIPFRLWLRSMWFYLYGFLPIVCFGFLILAMIPAAYILQSYPDSRALILHSSMIAVSGMVFSVCSGMILGRFIKSSIQYLEMVLLILLLVGLVVTAYQSIDQTMPSIPYRRDYAIRWDTRDGNLRKAKDLGENDIAAAGLEQYFGLHDLAFEPDNWINVCVAKYYGFESVRGR